MTPNAATNTRAGGRRKEALTPQCAASIPAASPAKDQWLSIAYNTVQEDEPARIETAVGPMAEDGLPTAHTYGLSSLASLLISQPLVYDLKTSYRRVQRHLWGTPSPLDNIDVNPERTAWLKAGKLFDLVRSGAPVNLMFREYEETGVPPRSKIHMIYPRMLEPISLGAEGRENLAKLTNVTVKEVYEIDQNGHVKEWYVVMTGGNLPTTEYTITNNPNSKSSPDKHGRCSLQWEAVGPEGQRFPMGKFRSWGSYLGGTNLTKVITRLLTTTGTRGSLPLVILRADDTMSMPN